jgi:pimeloyl-ACP methyl ester carboxylesterase
VRPEVVGVHAVVALAAVTGAWWIPRGPTSTAESLVSLVVGLALGLAAGAVTRSRWAAITAPLTYVVAFEAMRAGVGVEGPTVEGFRLSTYGVIALVTGRGFHGLVVLFPMAWGAAAGSALRNRAVRRRTPDAGPAPSRLGRWTRGSLLVVSGVALALVTAALARPASTAPITDADGVVVPGSITELTTVEVYGHDLGLMIRGSDRSNPVLLFLAGGPGGSEVGAMRRHLPALEDHFVVATWDQRGTGRSYGELDPTETLTLEGSVADTLAVTDYLRERFDTDRVYLVGQSWGTTLGVLAAQEAPEKYAAFVGVGQMVSQLATDRIYYADTLAWAQDTGQDGLAAELERIGPPPYSDARHYETVLSHEMEMYPYDHSANSEGQGQMSENLFVSEYSLTEQIHVLAATLDTFSVLYPQLQDIDFRDTATDFEIPMFFVQGAHEAPGRAEIFADWYPQVEAPVKEMTTLDTSGHRPLFEQPDAFVDYLTDVVLPRTTQ